MTAYPVAIGDVRQATLTAVVGADGFVGSGLASALGAKRIVYGPTLDGDVHIARAKELLGQADVVINCGGFRVRPGCDYGDYQRSHEGSTSAFAPWIRKDALLLHISSASVLGKGQGLGNQTPPNPETFPSPAYALAKLEEDRYLEKSGGGAWLQGGLPATGSDLFPARRRHGGHHAQAGKAAVSPCASIREMRVTIWCT